MSRQVAAQAPIKILVQEDVHLDQLENLLARCFKHRKDLVPFDTGKSFEEIFNGIACLQMVEEALDGDAGPDENGRSPEDVRV